MENEWYSELQREFSNSNDRSIVIVGCALLHDNLLELLKEQLIDSATKEDPLFDSSRPISTFSSIIELSFRIGIIDKEIKGILNSLRRLRNECAHSSKEVDLREPPYCDVILSIRERMLTHFDPKDLGMPMVATGIFMTLIGNFVGALSSIKINLEREGRPTSSYMYLQDGRVSNSHTTKPAHPSTYIK